jgi:hypothetical protein
MSAASARSICCFGELAGDEQVRENVDIDDDHARPSCLDLSIRS